MNSLELLLSSPFIVCFDGEEGGAAGGEGGAAGGEGGNKGGTAGGEITPEMQKIIDQRVTTLTKDSTNKARKVMDELDAIKKRSDFTQSQRDDLEKRVETISKELLTKEQIFEQEKKKQEKASAKQVETLTQDRDIWRNRFTDSTITRAITDASAKNDAFDSDTIVAILRPNAQLIETLDKENKPTGNFDVKVKFIDPEGKDGKPAELILSVPDAVKRMTELEKFQYLFKGKGAGGTGRNNQGAGGKLDIAELAKDPVAYREARKKGQVEL